MCDCKTCVNQVFAEIREEMGTGKNKIDPVDIESIAAARDAMAHAWCETDELRDDENMPPQLLGRVLNIRYAIESAEHRLDLLLEEEAA